MSQTAETCYIIITGLSGAGKSQAVQALEDLGYFCVDNLPPALLSKLAELCAQSGGKVHKIALVIDIRGGDFFDDLFHSLRELEEQGFSYSIFFLEASDEVLVSRFKETRRPHPFDPAVRVLDAIRAERKRLRDLRGQADRIIDTSDFTTRQLKGEIVEHLQAIEEDRGGLVVSVISFGFKYGLPLDADLVFDLRFLPNPHYVGTLRASSGLQKEVRKYIMQWPVSRRFVTRLKDFLGFVLPHYASEGKSHLAMGIGCTGGRHRSVTVTHLLTEHLREQGYRVNEIHRDISRGLE